MIAAKRRTGAPLDIGKHYLKIVGMAIESAANSSGIRRSELLRQDERFAPTLTNSKSDNQFAA
jgi:hypothetical protein